MSLPADPAAMAAKDHGAKDNNASRESSPAEEEVILATAGYDHCIKFWMAHTGKQIQSTFFPYIECRINHILMHLKT